MNSHLFHTIPQESQKILNDFDSLIQDIRPLTSKQLSQLPDNVRELSHLLTDERGNRRMGYMNSTVSLTAYVRYFMWWNLVRLTPVFSGFYADEETRPVFDSLKDESVILDIGSGPLTIPVALWLAVPELRKKKLTVYCLDYSQTSLAFGEEILYSVAAKTAAATPDQTLWQIIRVKGPLGTSIKQKADFVFCANMFNELFWDTPKPLEQVSKKYSGDLLSYLKDRSSVFVAEPGVPRAARFVSLLRDSLSRRSYMPLSPCPHSDACPMDGRKGGKWCHFTLLTDEAPSRLQKLSASAGIPKDRASLSFILSSSLTARKNDTVNVRIVSDSIRLHDGNSGRYGCSSGGLALAVAPENMFASGDLADSSLSEAEFFRLPMDQKSGARKVIFQETRQPASHGDGEPAENAGEKSARPAQRRPSDRKPVRQTGRFQKRSPSPEKKKPRLY